MPPKNAAPPALPKSAPPPPDKVENIPPDDSNSGMAAVMNELVSGSIHLKKVTDDMKTKNRKNEDESGVVPVTPAVPKPELHPQPKVASSSAPILQPVCEIQRSNWVVENYVNHPGVLKLENCDMKQIVYVSKCTNSTIYVDCKVKSITLDGCKRVNLIVNSVISSVELVNCERCKVHSVNELPSLCIDKCSGVTVTLSPASINCEFTTSKSSEMNVAIPIGTDGDYKELPIPEQYVHRVNGADTGNFNLKTDVSSLYH
jgi:adenylyl cyclase-associated protein